MLSYCWENVHNLALKIFKNSKSLLWRPNGKAAVPASLLLCRRRHPPIAHRSSLFSFSTSDAACRFHRNSQHVLFGIAELSIRLRLFRKFLRVVGLNLVHNPSSLRLKKSVRIHVKTKRSFVLLYFGERIRSSVFVAGLDKLCNCYCCADLFSFKNSWLLMNPETF